MSNYICDKHKQRIIILESQLSNPSFQKLCLKCIAELKSYFVGNNLQELNRLKSQLIKDKNIMNKKNIELINNIKINFDNLKHHFQLSIDKYIDNFNYQIQLIWDYDFKYRKEVERLPTKDFDTFLKQILLIENQFNYYSDMREHLLNNSQTFQNDQLMKKIKEIMMMVNQGLQQYKNFIIKHYDSQLLLNQKPSKSQLTCKNHIGFQIVRIDLNHEQKTLNRLVCSKCIKEQPANYVTLDEFQVRWKNYLAKVQPYKNQLIDNVQYKTRELSDLFQDIQLQILNSIQQNQSKLKDKWNQILNSFKIQLDEQPFDQIIEDYQKLENIAQDIIYPDRLQYLQNKLLDEFCQWNASTNSQVQKFEQVLVNCLQQFQNRVEQIILDLRKTEEYQTQSSIKQFNFELMKQYSIQQIEWCNAITFNQDASVIFAGCDEKIKVYENKCGKMNQIQKIILHTGNIITLNFMKISNQFVSGSSDQLIIIWQLNHNKLWICQQILIGHTNDILCLVLNNNDDLIISGSSDSKIKFWIKQNQWLCQQTITDHNGAVFSLSLNENQNYLISCSYDEQILIMQFNQPENSWNVIQKIQTDQYGLRISFISENQFVFQPRCKEQLQLYEMNFSNNQYSLVKEITVKCNSKDCSLFPIQLVKSKCLLVNKNGRCINLIQIQTNGDLKLEQSFEFGSDAIYGQISDDGEYLITWDQDSKQIQIRKFQEW